MSSEAFDRGYALAEAMGVNDGATEKKGRDFKAAIMFIATKTRGEAT